MQNAYVTEVRCEGRLGWMREPAFISFSLLMAGLVVSCLWQLKKIIVGSGRAQLRPFGKGGAGASHTLFLPAAGPVYLGPVLFFPQAGLASVMV